jgi:hypothetical protein
MVGPDQRHRAACVAVAVDVLPGTVSCATDGGNAVSSYAFRWLAD